MKSLPLPPGLKKLLPVWDQKEWGKRKAREEGIVRETKKKIRKERKQNDPGQND